MLEFSKLPALANDVIALALSIYCSMIIDIKLIMALFPFIQIIFILLSGIDASPLANEINANLRLRQLPTDTISVLSFGANGVDLKEDSEAFQKAIDEAAITSKVLFVPKGNYLIKDVLIRSNSVIVGAGKESVLQKVYSGIFGLGCNFSYINPINDPTGKFNVKNISISNLAFKGTSNIDGFSEHKHLLNLNGVENVRISDCFFYAFNGDAIYIGSDVGVEKHNKNITINNSYFDGVNKENRNAISVIDGSGVNIINNRFFNTTRSTMPGAIDFEPDANFYHVIRDVNIAGNFFNNIGGNVGAISMFFPLSQQKMKTPVKNITIYRNNMENVAQGIGIFQKNKAEANGLNQNIVIAENTVINSKGYPLAMYGTGDVVIEKNFFDLFKTNIFFGLPAKDYQTYNILFKKNTLKRNNGDGIGISLRTVSIFNSEDNIFDDIGMTDGKYGIAIIGETGGRSEYVKSFRDVLLGDRTTAFTAINPGHITKEATNQFKKPITQKQYINHFPFKKD